MTVDDGRVLLQLARTSIETALQGGEPTVPDMPWLLAPGAAFVTLRHVGDGSLRGCVGSIDARQPLGDTVVSAARSAAFRDARFPPLTGAEFGWIRLEVSVLSPLSHLPVADEADASRHLEQTRPGVVLQYGQCRGVLLPKVWDSIPDAAEFLYQLKRKAGLPLTFWSQAIELQVFSTHDFAEGDTSHTRQDAS